MRMTPEMTEVDAAARAKKALLWMVSIVAAAAMAMAGVTKFTAPDMWDANFIAWGYGTAFKSLIGVLEIVGGIGAWKKPLSMG